MKNFSHAALAETKQETKKRGDRRVKYTKAALRESLITLLMDRPIEKVSVKRICELADVNRSTFYAHYTDAYDLLRQTEQDMIVDMGVHLSNLYDTENRDESLKTLKKIFDYIVGNAAMCKVLLGEHGDTGFIKEILMVVQRSTLKEWEGKIRTDADTLEYAMIFSVHGSIGVIRQWLKNGLDKSSAEMSDVVMSLTLRGLSLYVK
jgi:AcrR family transcriptional regulator